MAPIGQRHLDAIGGRHDDLLYCAAKPDRHAAIAHLVHEIVHNLAIDEFYGWHRGI